MRNILIAMTLLMCMCRPAQAQEYDVAPGPVSGPYFNPRVTDVSVFKDGHALILCKAEVNLVNGWCRTREVPAAMLGAFWAFVTDEEAEVDFVKAGFVDTREERPCLSIDEIIRVNTGHRVKLTDTHGKVHEGILRRVLTHTETENIIHAGQAGAYNYRTRRYNDPTRPTDEEKTQEVVAAFISLQTGDGIKIIKRAEIRDLVLEGDQLKDTFAAPKRVREIAMHVTKNGKPYSGKTEVGFVYVQRGIRWIPEYTIDLDDDDQARLQLQGTLINDLVKLEDSTVHFVIGVPSFIMKDNLSPMALRDIKPHLTSFFAPPGRGGRGSQYDYLSNAMMSQAVMPHQSSAEMSAGLDIPQAEGRLEDLFLHTRRHISLNKGDRAIVKLMETKVPYDDVYVWELPLMPPRKMWSRVPNNQHSKLAQALAEAKIKHAIRLKNTGKTPWTTGPASLFKKGKVLAQAMMTYTSVGNYVEVPITVAVDVNGRKDEKELNRIRKALRVNSHDFTKVEMSGKLTITNFKDKDVKLIVKRKLLGKITSTDPGAETEFISHLDDPELLQRQWWYSYLPWYWYHANYCTLATWELDLDSGKTLELNYKYHYYEE